MTLHAPAIVRLSLRLAALVLLVAFEPVVLGHYWYTTHPIDARVQSLRQSVIPLLMTVVIASWLGGRMAVVVAPAVVLTSGVWYAYVELYYKGNRDFEENIFASFVFAVILALPVGLLFSGVRRSRRAPEQPISHQ